MKYYYISPTGTGDGSNPSTPGSISSAKVFARTWCASDDVTVYVAGGDYFLTEPLALTAADSGSNGHTIEWRAYLSAPTFSGGQSVTGWSLHDAGKNIWKASIPVGSTAHTLYVNGSRAKSPDIAIDSSWGTTIPASAGIPQIHSIARSFWKFKTFSWAENSQRIVGYTYSNGLHSFTLADDGYSAAVDAGWWGGSYEWVNNRLIHVYEALSQGCAYVDGPAGFAYYVPNSGDNLASAKVILPVLEQVVTVSGASNITFAGIQFAHTDWSYQINNQYMEFQANYFWTCQQYVNYVTQVESVEEIPDYLLSIMPACVDVAYSTNINFQYCGFLHTGGRGVSLSDGSQYCSIDKCLVLDTACNGASLGGVTHNAVTAGQTYEVKNCTISNSQILNASIEVYGGVGIFVGYTRSCTISHNTVRHVPYTGISVGWGWGRSGSSDAGNNTIAYNVANDIANTGSTDGGSIYTLGSQYGTQIANNYVWDDGTDHTNCVYIDEGTAGVSVTDNVLVKIASPANGGAWMAGNCQTDESATGNYALAGMKLYYGGGWFRYEDPGVPWNNIPLDPNIHDATYLASADKSNWPTGALAVVAAAGAPIVVAVDPLTVSVSSGAMTGQMQTGLIIQGLSGATFGTITYPTDTTWSMEISNLSPGNNTITVQALDGSAVVGTASAVVTYSASQTQEVTTAGGVVLGGTSKVSVGRACISASGFVVGGASYTASGRATSSASGLVLGSANQVVSGRSIASSGGLVLGGTSAVGSGTGHSIQVQSAGGAVLGGASPVCAGRVSASSGGLVLGGNSVIIVPAHTMSVVSTGGVILGGTSSTVSSRASPSTFVLRGPNGIIYPFHIKTA